MSTNEPTPGAAESTSPRSSDTFSTTADFNVLSLVPEHIPGYGHIPQLGHPDAMDLLADPVVVEEKVDGSQFAAMLTEKGVIFRSKNREVFPAYGDKNFTYAMNSFWLAAEHEGLRAGMVYYGEVLARPRHNVLKYSRVPKGNFVIFDIVDYSSAVKRYLTPKQKAEEAARIGFECVPCYSEGLDIRSMSDLAILMDQESFLGGTLIEGLVFKNYQRYDRWGKPLMGKLVREEFKQERRTGGSNPHLSPVDTVMATIPIESVWQHAVQHLADDGVLTNTPADIGPLLTEIQDDFLREYQEDVARKLTAEFWPQVKRTAQRGFAEWYKKRLVERQFGEGVDTNGVQ